MMGPDYILGRVLCNRLDPSKANFSPVLGIKHSKFLRFSLSPKTKLQSSHGVVMGIVSWVAHWISFFGVLLEIHCGHFEVSSSYTIPKSVA